MQDVAIVGIGMRSAKFIDGITALCAEHTRIAALCDHSLAMLEAKGDELAGQGVTAPWYQAADFDRMVRETEPDLVLVLTPDFAHADYVCRAMELGCDVVVEKPLATRIADIRRMLETQARTGRACRVAHNFRYAAESRQVKEVLLSGAIGPVVQVVWNTGVPLWHGVKFFHRWHGERASSGTLLVSKCSHNFDLVNFWLGDVPRRVTAAGRLVHFGPGAARRMGLTDHGPRCAECALTDRCPYYWDTVNQASANERPEAVQARGEETGYYRDQCVFRPEIDTYDTFSVHAEYEGGALLSFNWMVGRSAGELTFQGTHGSLEVAADELRVRRHDGRDRTHALWKGTGGHGGGDPLLYQDLFGGGGPDERLGCAADLRDGAWAVLTGLGALESIDHGRTVNLPDLLSVPRPDFQPMPSFEEPMDPAPPREVLQKHNRPHGPTEAAKANRG